MKGVSADKTIRFQAEQPTISSEITCTKYKIIYILITKELAVSLRTFVLLSTKMCMKEEPFQF